MPLITETYYLSLTQDNRGILRLRCSQDDTLRTVNLKLYNNGSIFVIPSGISASISGVKQNGTVFSKPCTISQNRESVVLQLSSDITNVDGIIVAEIVLNDGEGGRLGTSNFIIQVEKNPIRAGVVQDTETPIEYINDFIEKIQTLTARLNNLITPSGDPSLAEVVDARIGILDSTTYQTLGARLNAEFQRLSNVLSGAVILESTGDTTDRTSEILSKLNTYGTCKLGKGDFYVSGLVMPEGSHLVGSGKSTRIILPSSVTDGYVVKPKSNCIIENISFYGGFTGTHSELIASAATATRHCIILDRVNSVSSENVILNNIFINNFVGSAIIQRYTTGCHCEDIIINMCYAGIDISNASYDGQCINISMTNTRYGVVQNGSNFVFTNCVSKDSDQHILSDQQNTECTFSSCTFSDSSLETTSRLATLSNARNGFVFDNCTFDSSLKMLLNACDGIVIKGTNFVGSDTFRIIVSNGRNTLLLITDCIADVEPIVTNAGENAHITSCYLKDGTAWTISEADITVDDELSDESENPVQNKVINREISQIKADLSALESDVSNIETVDLATATGKAGVISGASGNWVDRDIDFTYFIPVKAYDEKVTVTANAECPAVLGILINDNVTHKSPPSYATGCGREVIPAGTTKTFTIPSNAKFLAIAKIITWNNHDPESVVVTSRKFATIETIESVNNSIFTDSKLLNWQIGSYNYPNGNYYASDARLRLIDYVGVTEKVYSAQAGVGYEMAVFAWNAETKAYVGAYIVNNGFATSGTLAWMSNFDFSDYPEYTFRIVIRDAVNPEKSMDISEAESCTFKLSKFKTDKTLSLVGAIADAGATGLRFSQIENALTNSHGITHETPNSQGELNVVRRARQLTDIKWTPAFDFPRISQLARYSGGANDPYFFEDVFKAGVEYTGIPYGQANKNTSQWGYSSSSGFKVGWGVGLDTFISAIGCTESVVAKESSFLAQGSNHKAGFYATVCTALCGYALELPMYYSSSKIGYAPGMQYLGKVKDLDLENLHLGDMLWNVAHGAILTDKLRDENGDIIAIELSEETTIGNDDWNVQGSQLGGIARRRMWPLSDFLKWKDYGVYRYDNVDNTTYTKSPYVDTGDEGEALRIVHFPVLPYMGENFRYIENHIGNTKILTPGYRAGATDKLRVKKDGENWNVNGTTDYYEVSGQYVEVGFSAPGTYEAYLCQVSNDEEIIQTRAAHWTVVAK